MKHTDKVKGLTATARALEDSFFAKENERILRELRAASVREEKKKEFREYLNIKNDELLDALVSLAVEPETLVAFTLVPLVEVAWADGEIQPKERDAIIKAAIERGVGEDSPTAQLLRNWLQTRPDPKLLETWRELHRGAQGLAQRRDLDRDEKVGDGPRPGDCGSRRWFPRSRFDLGGREEDARRAGVGLRVTRPALKNSLIAAIAGVAMSVASARLRRRTAVPGPDRDPRRSRGRSHPRRGLVRAGLRSGVRPFLRPLR